jgi:D-xylose transport system substrate-binding protein
MNRNTNRSLFVISLLVALSMLLSACGTPAAQPTQPAAPAATTAPAAPAATTAPSADCTPAGSGVTVGISMSDFATERWKPEADLMKQLLEAKGYKVLVQEANHDVKLQNDQIDNMVSQGAKGLIIVAEDGAAAATAVDKAAQAGVKAIAYDRLIKSPNIAAYISFNNEEVGRQQALGVLKAVDIDGGKWTKDNPLKLVMLGGSPTDNNAILFRKGQMDIVQPYVDKGIIKIVADQWVDNWDAANALKLMENILTAQKNNIDAVVASNDGTGLGALQAMKAQGLAGKVPISGQDATADGSNSIVKGELTVSILKDIRNLGPLGVELIDGLLQCKPNAELKQYTMAELTNDPSLAGNVTAQFLPVQQVNKDNVYDLVVKSEFQPYDAVYRDIPDAQKPPKPGETSSTTPAADCTPAGSGATVGISMSDFATERWKPEADLMKQLLEAKGYKVLVQEANHDVKLQNDQIDNMVSQGAKGLIIVAEDGAAAATAVDKAAQAGVKAIAYDRLIKSPNIAAYISFNNEEVGRQQALGVLKAVDIDGGKWTKDNPLKLVMLGGSPTDNNAILFRKGQMDIVQPYVDKGIIKIVADQWVDNWDAANALKLMENILTAQKNNIDAVVASNDGTGLGALQAMKAQGLAGKVPISGQDATADGSNSIVKGELTVSILKDIRNLGPLGVELIDGLLQCKPNAELKQYTMAELTNDPSLAGNVTAQFLPVQQVNKDNVYDLVVKSEFQPYDAVYRDIPDAQKPPKP